ncbi:MAG: hypothetical protein ABSH22_04960 [Tepidisphaeraceae bacterium]
MVLANELGLFADGGARELDAHARRRQVLLHLLANGLPVPSDGEAEFEELCKGFQESFKEQARLLASHRCPADQRIEAYLQAHFSDLNLNWTPRLPSHSLILDQYGIARELSLPIDGESFTSELLTSYRVMNGVLHNPKSDRRTTQGTFHVAEGGLPVPGDKKAVPKKVFAELFRRAVKPPTQSLTLPFAASQRKPVRTFVSLLLRPIVCPEVPGVCSQKTMEIRFFAPGSLVSNLDFVESIFGNGGNPFLPRNDAGLDVEHWTGHSGCVILAPHLLSFTKKELGLPAWENATERQRRDGMCYKKETETYNDGTPFKITCRSAAGVIVTILADNYYGYCKKEVKTQISYAANLYGNVEEEHSGGAIAFASFSFGDEYQAQSVKVNGRTFEDVKRDYAEYMDIRPEGYGIDWKFPDLVYVPEDMRASTIRQQVWWTHNGKERHIPLLPGKVYMTPSGFKVRMEKHPGAPSWRIIGARGDGTFCHKPCTVSGGGKSEISKSLRDYMLYGPIFVADLQRDLDLVEKIMQKDFSDRWRSTYANKPTYKDRGFRPLLSPERTLGSLIKLLSPSPDYSDEYNAWLASIPNYIYPIVFIIKRFYNPEWKGDWRSHFGVDIVNGYPGNELKFEDRKLIGTYLRVGLMEPAAWRTFKVRQDFAAASKVQTEDDISASVVVPLTHLAHDVPGVKGMSRKFSINCEYRLFQRPDDAVHRGLDKQTESDMARPDNFISNFEPLNSAQAQAMVEKVTEFEQFTSPMRHLIQSCADAGKGLFVSSAHPRLVDGKPSKNPRYLQIRPDLIDPMSLYVAERGMRLFYAIPADEPVLWPVDAVLIGRRNNPAEPAANIRGLAVYNPIHYQELPELFMDLICSLTGKSPSTTGAGSEGALTKSPFNALRPTIDLNNALVSYILTGLGGFSTAAGYIGPKVRVDHDISLLVPELVCRLTIEERDPEYLIRNGHLEPMRDYVYEGEKILASRLGYRITAKFVQTFFGRVFDNPGKVFDEAILRPETQDRAAFADGVKNITEAQERVAQDYFKDGSIEDACPPLKALLTIMAKGSFEGKDAGHPDIRAMFTREYLLASDWYRQRLAAKQRKDIALWKRHLAYLDGYAQTSAAADEETNVDLPARRALAAAELERVSSPAYLQSLVGTLAADPSAG